MRPLHLATVLWGEEFRRYFLEYCVASLLAPGNVPAIEARAGSAFLVCTTEPDWRAMQDHPAFAHLNRHIETYFVPLPPAAPGATKMAAMTRGHRALSEILYADRALGMFVYPDTVFSNRVIREIQRHARQGKKVVLAHCPRFANEGFLNALRLKGVVGGDQVLDLAPAELFALSLPHLHSEHLAYEWCRPYFLQNSPSLIYWSVAGGSELLVHSLTWAPILLDYAALARHDLSALQEWTIDGDYVFRNFGESQDIYAEFDCSRIALISFTPESKLSYLPLRNHPDARLMTKLSGTNRWLYSPAIDPLKRALFRQPVRITLHRRPLGWLLARMRSAPLVALMLGPPRLIDFLFRTRNLIRRAISRALGGVWRRFLPAELLVSGDLSRSFSFWNDFGPGRERTVRAARRLRAGRWYWELKLENQALEPALLALAEFGIAHDADDRGGTAPARWRIDGQLVEGGRTRPWGLPLGASGVAMVAFDNDAGLLWYGANGCWFESGDPARGNGPAARFDPAPAQPWLRVTGGVTGSPVIMLCGEAAGWHHPPPAGYRAITEAPEVAQPSRALARLRALLLGLSMLPLDVAIWLARLPMRAAKRIQRLRRGAQ